MLTESVHHSLPPGSYTSSSTSSPPVTVILTVILLVFFFIGFLSIYLCRCFMQSMEYSWHLRDSPNGTSAGQAGLTTTVAASGGLDPSIMRSFLTFTYSNVKDYRKERYGLECAICLVEFEGHHVLRLMTSCCHVFHQECIDLWLKSNRTCPVCRRNLDVPENSLQKSLSSFINGIMQGIDENESLEDSFSIDIKDENGVERGGSGGEHGEASVKAGEGDQRQEKNSAERFSRSHSTGHSIRTNADEDKFTLRIPEHVKAKIIRGHNWTRSCTTFREYKSKTSAGNGGFGEASGGSVSKVPA